MTFGLVVVCALGCMFILYRYHERRLDGLVRWTRHLHDRISGLEVKTYAQDVRLEDQRMIIKRLLREVRELGHDVGWFDDMHRTEVIRPPPLPPTDDDNPP